MKTADEMSDDWRMNNRDENDLAALLRAYGEQVKEECAAILDTTPYCDIAQAIRDIKLL